MGAYADAMCEELEIFLPIPATKTHTQEHRYRSLAHAFPEVPDLDAGEVLGLRNLDHRLGEYDLLDLNKLDSPLESPPPANKDEASATKVPILNIKKEQVELSTALYRALTRTLELPAVPREERPGREKE